MKPWDENEISESARRAFEEYPGLKPTAAFNRAVLERLELENQRRRSTLVGQIEEFLGLNLWRFAATNMLGALVPAILLGALFYSSRAPQNTEEGSPSIPPQLRSIGPFYARELELQSEFFPTPSHQKPSSKSQGDEISWLDSKSHWG